MKSISREEAIGWMVQHLPAETPLQQVTQLPQLDAVGYGRMSIPFPVDSSHKCALVQLVYKECLSKEQCLLVHVKEWQIFPSCGHIPLLLRLRQALGEWRPIEKCPGHLFCAAEGDDAISIILMAMLFYWDCLVVSESGKVVLYVSHDERCDLFSSDLAMLDRLKDAIADFSSHIK
jgi:hypothetical protein